MAEDLNINYKTKSYDTTIQKRHLVQWFLIFFDRLPFLDLLRYEITLK